MRRGSTTSSNMRSCDTVSAGAFFPQADLHVPQKEMRQHRRQHMVVPARILPHFIVVHPQVGFAFFTALFNRPAHAAEPDKQGEPTTEWGITLPGSNREIFGVKELHLTSQLVVRCLRK